jgi:hypothetical protein
MLHQCCGMLIVHRVHTHAGALMILLMFLQIRQNDRLALSKLVSGLTRGSVRSPLAQCLLIRYTCQVCKCYLYKLVRECSSSIYLIRWSCLALLPL